MLTAALMKARDSLHMSYRTQLPFSSFSLTPGAASTTVAGLHPASIHDLFWASGNFKIRSSLKFGFGFYAGRLNFSAWCRILSSTVFSSYSSCRWVYSFLQWRSTRMHRVSEAAQPPPLIFFFLVHDLPPGRFVVYDGLTPSTSDIRCAYFLRPSIRSRSDYNTKCRHSCRDEARFLEG